MTFFRLAFCVLAVPMVAVGSTLAQEPTYWQDIRPIFRKHCTVCHAERHLSKPDVSGGLALDSYDLVKKGSNRAVILPGKSGKSLLVEYLVTSDAGKRMPLDGDPLPKETIEKIRRWIDAGVIAGEAPKTDVVAAPTTSVLKSRRLEVAFPTTATLPADSGVAPKAGKLELAVKIGPLSPIAALAFSPNGKLLAVGSYGQLVVWNVETARPVQTIADLPGAVHDVKFSPDGKILAVGGGQPSGNGDIRLFQTSDGKLLGALRGHHDVVFSLAFTPDSKRLVSGSFDQHVKIWDVEKKSALRTLAPHSDFVYAVGLSPKADFLGSASKDRTVQWINMATGKTAFTFSGMDQDVLAFAVHPDGTKAVSSGFEPGIYWWNTATGEKIKTQGGHGVAVHELVFSKDGKRLASAGADKTLRLWDGSTGAPIKTISVGASVYAVAFSPDGKRVASGSFDGIVRLWDEKTGRHLISLVAYPGQKDGADWLVLAPEGYANASDRCVSIAKWRVGKTDAQADRVWKTVRQPEQLVRAMRGEIVSALVFGKK